MASHSLNLRLPALARICGGSLLLAYAVTVLFALFPLDLGSPLWGSQLSGRIIDNASIALVGVALLCGTAFVEQLPEDPDMAPRRTARLLRQRASVLRLCRLGVIGLALLALWQLPLLLGATSQINQRNLSQADRISPAIENAQQSIRQAPAEVIEQRWRQVIAAGAPLLNQPNSSTEQKRQALLAAIKAEQQQLDRSINNQGSLAMVSTVRDTLRRITLCFIYGAGFFALRRSLV